MPLEPLIQFGIYALMGVCLLGALLSVLFKNLFHSALALTGALLGIAGVYLALHADFIAMIQILIYVGAIMTLIAFAIMLTEHFNSDRGKTHNAQGWAALGGGLLLLTIIVKMIQVTPWPILKNSEPVNTAALGMALLGKYVLPFEIISIVLIAAMVGAIVVARKDLKS